MSTSVAETLLRQATQQRSQIDINESLFRTISELIREIKDMENEIQRVRRVSMRRF